MICAFGTLAALVLFAILMAFVADDPLFRDPSENNEEQDCPGAQPQEYLNHSSALGPVKKPAQRSDCQKIYATKQQPGRLEYFTFGVSVLTLLGVGTYTYFTYRLYKSAETQFGISVRPWVGLSGEEVTRIDKDAIEASIEFENAGRSPATSVWYRDIAFTEMDSKRYAEVINRCSGKPRDSGIGVFLMPRQHRRTLVWARGVRPNTMAHFRHSLGLGAKLDRSNLEPVQSFLLIGCIDYAWGDTAYRTRFCAQYEPTPDPTGKRPYGVFSYCTWGNTADSSGGP